MAINRLTTNKKVTKQAQAPPDTTVEYIFLLGTQTRPREILYSKKNWWGIERVITSQNREINTITTLHVLES